MANLPAPILGANRFFAIQLTDTDRKKWTNDNSLSRLIYSWEDIGVPGMEKKDDISIAVAKKLPDTNNKKIKAVTSAIYDFSRLKKGDGILGVNGERRVSKIGRVVEAVSKSFPDYRAEIEISWLSDVKYGEAGSNIFDSNLDIQKVTNKMVNKLNLPIVFTNEAYERYYDTEYLTKEIPYLDLPEAQFSEKEDKGGRINLFYGTNRNTTGIKDIDQFYGNEVDELKFGRCEVSIPRGHVQGKIERPFTIFDIELFSEKEKKHIVVKNVFELTESNFISEIVEDIQNAEEKSALIFIHGYNNSFVEAARRTAQIAWDVPFKGIAGFYSWPSCGEVLSYLKDGEHAEASIPDFKKFIETIINVSSIEKLHIIAHSMGSRLMSYTLRDLSKNALLNARLSIIEQIILAAPDIDQLVFKNTILSHFKRMGSRRTLYSSDKDKALHFSETLRRGLARLGDAGSSLFVSDGLDTIDASNVNSSGNHHSYIFDTKEVLTDLYYLLNMGLSPMERRLRAKEKDELKYWLFPK